MGLKLPKGGIVLLHSGVIQGLCPSVLPADVVRVLIILMVFFRLLYLKYYDICNYSSNGTLQKFVDMLIYILALHFTKLVNAIA